ncbi:MAG: hypothetical protein P4L57_05975 [Rhizomicrobium sp.]|nr:hypothetical protein [Rhizomicrobium sp.]
MHFFEQSKDVLRIISFPKLTAGTAAIFDRVKKRAVIISFAMLVPVKRTVLALDDIETAQVRKRERLNGLLVYGLTLRRKHGGDIPLRCSSRDDALKYQRAIAEFLAAS